MKLFIVYQEEDGIMERMDVYADEKLAEADYDQRIQALVDEVNEDMDEDEKMDWSEVVHESSTYVGIWEVDNRFINLKGGMN